MYEYDRYTNRWNQLGLDIDGKEAEDEFGTSVALSADGSILAVGAPDNDSGYVRVYSAGLV